MAIKKKVQRCPIFQAAQQTGGHFKFKNKQLFFKKYLKL